MKSEHPTPFPELEQLKGNMQNFRNSERRVHDYSSNKLSLGSRNSTPERNR